MEDRTRAKALEIAYARLCQMGWRFNHDDIGRVAAQIILAMDQELEASGAPRQANGDE